MIDLQGPQTFKTKKNV